MILAGDIGGTKTNLALFRPAENGELGQVVVERTFPSAHYASLEAILAEFGASLRNRVTRAAFGIAGPVVDQTVKTPNLPWVISADAVAKSLGVERVRLLNDLEATALGLDTLRPDQLAELAPGDATGAGDDAKKAAGNRALIAAGTGCGMATIPRVGDRYVAVASEGGHIDFAPQIRLEADLLFWLAERFGGHVSYERIVSGPGLVNVYEFLREREPGSEPAWLAAEMQAGDAAAAVSGAALAGRSELAERALDLFASVYGAAAGNLALVVVATGGLYVGGGIAPKILGKLRDGTFMKSFLAKGRFRGLLEKVPVRVVLEPKTALYGAARAAASDDSSSSS